mmetsp:Transcript_27043/g.47762  ORF Transcript_27043/g.47762 Transcript_27043/m.47762 type:complete len:87 (-) Transcript_27043:433-693(-)
MHNVFEVCGGDSSGHSSTPKKKGTQHLDHDSIRGMCTRTFKTDVIITARRRAETLVLPIKAATPKGATYARKYSPQVTALAAEGGT